MSRYYINKELFLRNEISARRGVVLRAAPGEVVYLIRQNSKIFATFPKGEGLKTFSRGEGGFSGGHTWTPEKTEVECGRRTFSFVNAKTC